MAEVKKKVVVYFYDRGSEEKGRGPSEEDGPNTILSTAVPFSLTFSRSRSLLRAKAVDQMDGQMDGGWAGG